jgi:LAO/AO transport system kinase
MKAGLMEIGDVFVLNKADREGAERLDEQLHAMLSLVMPRDGWHPPVIRTVATDNKGIDVLAETVGKFPQALRIQLRARQKTHRALALSPSSNSSKPASSIAFSMLLEANPL